jgi:trehalose 6-phosphate synthase/phosphatase
VKSFDGGWKERLLPILKMYADRMAGAFVEEKEFSLVWHYRAADPQQVRPVARELTDYLLAFTANIDVQVSRGSKVIEIRNAGINKGVAVQQWLSQKEFDCILALGDDATDEEMFTVLPRQAYSFHIGASSTRARFNLRDPSEVLQLLEELIVYEDARMKKQKSKAKTTLQIQQI